MVGREPLSPPRTLNGVTSHRAFGPFLVAIAALLWATDALFRFPSANQLDPALLVFIEHAVALAFLAPWVLFRYRRGLFRMSTAAWLCAIFAGAGGSALATLFFTASFRYVNPSVAILLQKLQPILVVALAFIFLGERPRRTFFGWALIAIAAGLILSFPDLKFGFVTHDLDPRSRGVLYSLAAAGIWALSTIVGKVLTRDAEADRATFWRFAFGLLTLGLILVLQPNPVDVRALLNPSLRANLAYMALVPGLAAMLIYYAGMRRTSAGATTLAELAFPVGAVIINARFLGLPLDPIQVGAGIVLLFAVTRISLTRN